MRMEYEPTVKLLTCVGTIQCRTHQRVEPFGLNRGPSIVVGSEVV